MIPSSLGFIYTPDFKQVLLITKQRPAFHKGKLNGLGGKCELSETPLACLVREVKEEADIIVPTNAWHKIGRMTWTEWSVDVYAAIYSENRRNAKTMRDGEINWYPVNNLPANIISNLNWLVPLGIDVLSNSPAPLLEINYKD